MLVATGLAVVIPQGNAFGDDVNFCVRSGSCPANPGDGVMIVARILQVKWSIVPGLNWEKGSSLRMENLITL